MAKRPHINSTSSLYWIRERTGRWENDALVYRYEFSAGGTTFALRNSTKFLANGKLVSEEFSSANGAPEVLLVHVEAVKK